MHQKKPSNSSLMAIAWNRPEINTSPKAEAWGPCGGAGDEAPSLPLCRGTQPQAGLWPLLPCRESLSWSESGTV